MGAVIQNRWVGVFLRDVLYGMRARFRLGLADLNCEHCGGRGASPRNPGSQCDFCPGIAAICTFTWQDPADFPIRAFNDARLGIREAYRNRHHFK
jgi:hypothetical protein